MTKRRREHENFASLVKPDKGTTFAQPGARTEAKKEKRHILIGKLQRRGQGFSFEGGGSDELMNPVLAVTEPTRGVRL